MRVVGLFAGIGGIEVGFRRAGHDAVQLCEIDSDARAVLQRHFPGVPIEHDVRTMTCLPSVDLVAAGFPCQDLSQAGFKVGIEGTKSGLVQHVFRLLRPKASRPEWVLLENVSYMLRLHGGAALTLLTDRLSSLGYRWAYRVIDARAFSVPQRRQRVLLLASREQDPAGVLLSGSYRPPQDLDELKPITPGSWYGFYWTEGRRGIGWAAEALPTIKNGSTLGIASPPAVWVSDRDFVGIPAIQDLERLQGFPDDWTLPASGRKGARWTLVGNAVCVPMAEWIARRLVSTDGQVPRLSLVTKSARWPLAATGYKDKVFEADATMWPMEPGEVRLREYVRHRMNPLSQRATQGFLSRATDSIIRYPEGFLDSVRRHLESTKAATESV